MFNSQMAPTVTHWTQHFIVKSRLSCSLKEPSVFSLKETLNFFFPWTFLNTAEQMAVPEYLGSDAPSQHKPIHK